MTDEKKIPLPEAPASLNFRGITQKGWDVQFTLRDVDEDALLERFGKLINKLEENYKVTPKGYRQPEGNGSQKVAPTTSVPPPVHQGTATVTQQEDLFFEAERLVGSTSGDKTYWKVQGGKFSKFGVNIWPEILEGAGFNPDQMDPKTTYDLNGYTAYYSLKENGKEDKVINLAKGS